MLDFFRRRQQTATRGPGKNKHKYCKELDQAMSKMDNFAKL